MGKDSKIEWTHHTFNPWIGCTKVSDGCTHCYAESMENRWGRSWGPTSPRRRTSKDYWKQPYKWDKEAAEAGERRRVFCASMADVGEDLADLIEPRRDLSIIIERTPHLDWLLLTKRPENMVRLFARWNGIGGWPQNVWVGTSVENQGRASLRIPELLKIPAHTRFLSCEPLIEAVDLNLTQEYPDCEGHYQDARHGLHWVIVGGESGHGARPMSLPWAISLKDQCKKEGIAFFMKQLGGTVDKRGDLESIPEELRVREFPTTALTI